jgi:hypothetical protein
MKKPLVLATAVFAVVAVVAGLGYYLFIRPDITISTETIASTEAAVDACSDCVFTLTGERLSLSDEFADSPDVIEMTGGKRASITTVRRKLIGLRAYCKDGHLYDGRDNRIMFFRIPETGQKPGLQWYEWADNQHKQASRLEQEGWTVIRMWQLISPK